MEIFTVTNDGFRIAPQTVISSESEFYNPDESASLEVVPFDYVKISRAGKHIAAKFAARYYVSGGYGLHIVPQSSENNAGENRNSSRTDILANYLDNSVFLAPDLTREAIAPAAELFSAARLAQFDKAIERCSEFTSLRTGDIVCLETAALPNRCETDDKSEKAEDAERDGREIVYKSLKIRCL